MSAEELKKFYKAKSKKPEQYGYDDNGNLIELNKEGTVIKTIALPDYRTPTYEEFDEMEEQRSKQIALANKETLVVAGEFFGDLNDQLLLVFS
jgi:1-deoxy-D-xylulose 5-phosphate reductoisomerase